GDAGRWPELFVLNRAKIRHRDRLAVGQVLTLPGPTPIKPRPQLYKVKKGDTLSGIARSKLGDASRWPEIATLNRDVVPDPDEIAPGLVLVIVKG
ncbi:MAG TPA: LysM peptidoglycan-binding domain-containing protein, partial [Actinomycetes bacterium]|nr:LysM peptidoglycan-binding domain-containing protein [Actinomycetes bacterium]